MGQVWGWGYGGEGQLGLGSRVKMVSSPHLISCIESASGKDKSSFQQGSTALQCSNVAGNYVTEIACGGRHSAVITGQCLNAVITCFLQKYRWMFKKLHDLLAIYVLFTKSQKLNAI